MKKISILLLTIIFSFSVLASTWELPTFVTDNSYSYYKLLRFYKKNIDKANKFLNGDYIIKLIQEDIGPVVLIYDKYTEEPIFIIKILKKESELGNIAKLVTLTMIRKDMFSMISDEEYRNKMLNINKEVVYGFFYFFRMIIRIDFQNNFLTNDNFTMEKLYEIGKRSMDIIVSNYVDDRLDDVTMELLDNIKSNDYSCDSIYTNQPMFMRNYGIYQYTGVIKGNYVVYITKQL